eukprot:m.243758 g.243758  ORF g.243758 m.243758 type:complete len:531 (+) comp19025_c1_seq1:93-1685(+)
MALSSCAAASRRLLVASTVAPARLAAAAAVAPALHQRRLRSTAADEKLLLPPMVYISGEEMTHYAMQLILKHWITPHCNTRNWEFYDLSCKARDDTEDQVLTDAVSAGSRVCAIFKEPTITPTEVQRRALGLRKAWGSPNGAMRRGWNGITISRDTIHIDGIELGFKEPVLFERHAVGGEYGAGWSTVGKGRLMTTFFPDDGSSPTIVDARVLDNDTNVAVVYHNPLDNVSDLAHHFFKRCLEARVVPYVVTKKTVFKWQEGFWTAMKDVFDTHYKAQFTAAGLLRATNGELAHLISDAATMQIIRWTKGGFGMAAHNYDGDMLTDEIAQVHRSPGFITSNLIGKTDDGFPIKEFEASHGTVADLWEAHLRGEETSLNPLGMVEALLGAMNHAAEVTSLKSPYTKCASASEVTHFTSTLRHALHAAFREGQGTRDMAGPEGLTTEAFVEHVGERLSEYLEQADNGIVKDESVQPVPVLQNVNEDALREMFESYDTSKSGQLKFEDFEAMLVHLGIAPKKVIPEPHGEDVV